MPPPRSLLLLGLGLARGRVCTSGSQATASLDRRDSDLGIIQSCLYPQIDVQFIFYVNV